MCNKITTTAASIAAAAVLFALTGCNKSNDTPAPQEQSSTAQSDTAVAAASGKETQPPAGGAQGAAPKTQSGMLAPVPAANGKPGDWTMWCQNPQRIVVVPDGKTPPMQWDVEAKENLLWDGQLGSQSYGSPVIAGGLVFIGTNNEAKRDPQHTADGGVLMIFRESDGKFLWQRYWPKLQAGRVNDWPFQGICSTVLAEGDHIWLATSRCEVVCMDVSPLRNGTGEPKEVWNVDMMAKLNVFPHNMTSCSIASYGDLIYVITGNGVDDTHINIPAPRAPSIVCFNKKTGDVVWTDNTPGENILHGQWSSPAIAEVNGRGLVIAPLGDGWIYAFDAKTGKKVWWFDSNDKHTVYPTTRNELIATPVVVNNKLYIANGQDPEHGEGPGHLWCIDITKEGDVSKEIAADDAPKPKPGEELVADPAQIRRRGKPNPNSAVVWDFQTFDANKDGKISAPVERMNRSISTVAVANGLCFAPDFSGMFHCLDANTGQHLWTHDMLSAMWGSPLVIGDKVYISDEEGDVSIFDLAKEKKHHGDYNLGSASYCSPVYANGILYLMNRERVFAVGEK